MLTPTGPIFSEAPCAALSVESHIPARPRRAQCIETELDERMLLDWQPEPYLTSEFAWRIIRELERQS